MKAIIYNSVPDSTWSITDWMNWHKALVKHYSSATVTIKKGDLEVLANTPAQTEFNSAFKKLFDKLGGWDGSGFLPVKQITSGLNADQFKTEAKYFGMWSGIIPSSLVKIRQYDASFIFGKAADTVGDVAGTTVTILKWTAIIGLPLAIAGVSAYVYNSFKKKKK